MIQSRHFSEFTLFYLKHQKQIIAIQKYGRRKVAMKEFRNKKNQWNYRKKIIQELIKTEGNYLLDLQNIHYFIYTPCSSFLSKSQMQLLFINILSIMRLHSNLYHILKEHLFTLHPWKSRIAESISHFIPFFKLYFEYYSNFEKSYKFCQ